MVRYLLLIVIIFLSMINVINAQQDSNPVRLLVMQDVVYPNKVEAYEKAQKDMNEFIKNNYPAVKWTCLQYDSFTYDYLVELTSYSQIDDMNKMWQEKMKTVDQNEYNKLANNFVGTISATNQLVVTLDKKGSYNSKDPYIKHSDAKFYHWDYFEFIPGKEDEALAVAREEAALSDKLNLRGEFHLWRVTMGQNTNAIVYASWDKDRVSFFTDMENDNKLAGKEMEELDKKFMSYVVKFDHWNGKTKPELSINPMDTAGK